MKLLFETGSKKTYTRVVEPADTASFDAGQVHPVYATFALGRDAEWVCRLFVLDMKEEDEEGIGTFLHVNHASPALVGQTVLFTATLEQIDGNSVVCSFEAHVEDRLVASGKTGQKILKKEKLERLFNRL